MRTISVLLTDLDNTLYDWVGFFAPSFRAMVHVLARELRVAEDILYDDFRALYGRMGTLEFQQAVQGLEIVKGLPEAEVSRLVYLATIAFTGARSKNLLPYPGVRETLEQFKDAGVAVIGVTNAPLLRGVGRLKKLGLWRHFDGLIGWEGEGSSVEARGVPTSPAGKLPSGRMVIMLELAREELKPSPTPYLAALAALGKPACECVVVGDSLDKDVAPGIALGMFGVWARYGQKTDPASFDTILRITHWDKDRIHKTYHERAIEPSMTIDAFDELRTLVKRRQLRLFEP